LRNASDHIIFDIVHGIQQNGFCNIVAEANPAPCCPRLYVGYSEIFDFVGTTRMRRRRFSA